MVDTLTARGCGVVICLSHMGYQLDCLLAGMIPGINAIVGGHDHFALTSAKPIINPMNDTTWVVQAGAFYLNVGKLQFVRTGSTVRLLDYQLLPVDENTPKDPTVDAIVALLISDIEGTYGPVYSQQIGEATGFFKEVVDSLINNGSRDTPIGNLVADAFRALTGTQIALEPGGSTAQPIYAGPLVAADLFRVVGYGFNTDDGLGYHLVRVKLSGAGLVAGIEFGLSNIESSDEYFLQSSGLRYTYNAKLPTGSRVASVTVNGLPLRPDSIYTVTANYFVKSFLDYLAIPYTDYHEYTRDTTEFMALSHYVAAHTPISPLTEGKVVSPVKEPKGSALPRCFGLDQNYPNPFNPDTMFGYDVPATSHVTVKVYSTLGQEVAVLVDEVRESGHHVVHFDASHLASGMYHCHFVAGGTSLLRKLLLVK